MLTSSPVYIILELPSLVFVKKYRRGWHSTSVCRIWFSLHNSDTHRNGIPVILFHWDTQLRFSSTYFSSSRTQQPQVAVLGLLQYCHPFIPILGMDNADYRLLRITKYDIFPSPLALLRGRTLLAVPCTAAGIPVQMLNLLSSILKTWPNHLRHCNLMQ